MRGSDESISNVNMVARARAILDAHKKSLPKMKQYHVGHNIWIELPANMGEGKVKKRIEKFIKNYEKKSTLKFNWDGKV